jgi:ribonuclease HIII
VQLDDFVGKPCRSKTAYEFLPKKLTKLNLGELKNKLEKKAIIEVNSKLLIIMKINNHTVSLFPSGKILVRGEREEKKAKQTAEEIIKLI